MTYFVFLLKVPTSTQPLGFFNTTLVMSLTLHFLFYVFYFMFLYSLVHSALASYITTVIKSFTLCYYFKFPPPTASSVIHDHCSHLLLYFIVLISHLNLALESYATAAFIVIYFIFVWL